MRRSMGVLTRKAILAHIEAGRSSIDPYATDQAGPALIDLTLGDEIRVIESGRGAVDRGRFVDPGEL
jgi:deoxycytidine triphosphate deaminase